MLNKDNIIIKIWEDNQIVDKIFWEKIDKKIILESDSNLKYLVISNDCDVNLEVFCNWNNSYCKVYGMFFSKNKKEIKWNISVNLSSNYAKTDIYLLWFVADDWIIKVKWNINIDKSVMWVSGHLLQENIILWKNIKIDTTPVLNVASNDVSASHWAKIQKLDTDKLFYMMSKWLSDDKSKEIIIKWYIDYILGDLSLDDSQKQEIENLILNTLLSKNDR